MINSLTWKTISDISDLQKGLQNQMLHSILINFEL